MGERARALADEFRQVNEQLITSAEAVGEEQWRNGRMRAEQGEDRAGSLAERLHHLAVMYPYAADWAVRLAKGQAINFSLIQLHREIEAQQKASPAELDRHVTLTLLRSNGQVAYSAIEELDDQALEQAGANGDGTTARWVIENLLIGQSQQQLASLTTGAR